MSGKAGKNVVQRAHRVGEGHSVEVSVVPNAKGGVAAMTAATDQAIADLKGWVNRQSCGN